MPAAAEKPPLRIGLIGTGYMGKAHVFGYATAEKVLGLPLAPVLHTVADATEELAAGAAAALGFSQWTADWRTMIDDPEIDVIHVTAPNALHKEMSLAAIAAGKHVHCEKPLATSVEDARAMTEAAEAAGVKTQVGFNYLCNPMMAVAKSPVTVPTATRPAPASPAACPSHLASSA
jgi:predicted dehydrogenase